MSERNNGIIRALFICEQYGQEEEVLLNWVAERGDPVVGARYSILVKKIPEFEN